MPIKSIQQQIFDLYDSLKELEGALAEKQGQINALTRNNYGLRTELHSLGEKVSGNRDDIQDLENENKLKELA